MDHDATAPSEVTRKSLLVMLAATLGLMTSSPTIVAAPQGLLLVPITHDFGIGRGTFNLLTGISMLIGAALTPFVGQVMNRHGARRLVLPGIVAFGLAQILFAAVPLSTPLLTAVLIVQGIASCLVTPLAYTRVISLWFSRRRGIMLGTSAAIGIGGGGGVCAGLVGTLLALSGWRIALLGTGVYILLVGALVVVPFLHEPKAVERAADADLPPDLPGITLREAFGSWSFRLVMLMVVCVIGALTVMMGHGPALLAGRGLNIGPYFLGCAAIGSLSGQLVSGQLLDRIDSPKVGLGFATASLIGGATILYFGTSAAIVLPAAVVMGLGQGAETGLASYYVSRFCGLRAYAGIFGIVMALVTASAAIFPPIAGYVFDATGSYDAMIPFIVLMLAVPPLAILLMPRYRFAATPIAAV